MKDISKTSEQDVEGSMDCGGLDRSYSLHLPSAYDSSRQCPLIILLHGRLGTGKKMMQQTGFNAIADREGFIAAYPDGFRRSWADGRGFTRADKKGVDDVGFIEQLIAWIRVAFPTDPSRTYIVGHSNGGFLTLRLCIEKTHLFSAGAVVAASLSQTLADRFNPKKPISVLFMHGTDDAVIPYGGSRLKNGAGILGVEETVKIWAQFNGCDPFPVLETATDPGGRYPVTIATHRSCLGNTKISLYRIQGGGHEWPEEPEGSSSAPGARSTRGIHASEEIWSFFKSLE